MPTGIIERGSSQVPFGEPALRGEQMEWLMNMLKSHRPQPKVELSEDVKKTLDEVSHILVGLNYKQIAKDYKQAVEKLLSLRPSWKPSEEQMRGLEYVIRNYREDSCNATANYLQEILDHLKNM